MKMQYIRWILPVVALLLIATILVLSPVIMTHAAGATDPSSAPAPTSLWYF